MSDSCKQYPGSGGQQSVCNFLTKTYLRKSKRNCLQTERIFSRKCNCSSRTFADSTLSHSPACMRKTNCKLFVLLHAQTSSLSFTVAKIAQESRYDLMKIGNQIRKLSAPSVLTILQCTRCVPKKQENTPKTKQKPNLRLGVYARSACLAYSTAFRSSWGACRAKIRETSLISK